MDKHISPWSVRESALTLDDQNICFSQFPTNSLTDTNTGIAIVLLQEKKVAL